MCLQILLLPLGIRGKTDIETMKKMQYSEDWWRIRYGSVELSRHLIQHETALNDRLQWLGMKYEDIKDIPLIYSQQVTEREIT